MHTITRSTLAAVAALLLSGAALANDVLMQKDGVLVTATGMTVYTFDKDVANSGKSACNGPCADLWPAVSAPDSVNLPYSVITRDDGTKQLAYKGKPLYVYQKDAPGQRNGDNFKTIWHVVKD